MVSCPSWSKNLERTLRNTYLESKAKDSLANIIDTVYFDVDFINLNIIHSKELKVSQTKNHFFCSAELLFPYLETISLIIIPLLKYGVMQNVLGMIDKISSQ